MSVIASGNTTTTALIYTGDTTGNLVFTTGGANTVALTIDSTQNITTTQKFASVSMPTGTILQVVTTNDSAQRATPNSTMTASGMSVTITPKFSTSKIFVQVTTCGYINTDGSGYYTIYRGSTNLAGSGNQLNILNVVDRYVPICMSYLDSPSTTSSTTYQIYFYKTGTNNVYVNATNSGLSVGAITVMEIAA
jgi:hypothetical protein